MGVPLVRVAQVRAREHSDVQVLSTSLLRALRKCDVHIRTHTRIHTYTCIHTHTHTHTHTTAAAAAVPRVTVALARASVCEHAFVFVFVSLSVCVWVCVCVRECMRVCECSRAGGCGQVHVRICGYELTLHYELRASLIYEVLKNNFLARQIFVHRPVGWHLAL